MPRKQSRPRRAKPGGFTDIGDLRIIGGQWRSRQLQFPAVDGVRPSPARVRETLFNWLAPTLPASHCLDLFAGSGALGLEALSRGAASVQFVDQSRSLCDALRQNLQRLGSTDGRVTCSNVTDLTDVPPADIIFMDPPFRQGWLAQLLPLIEQNGWIRRGGLVYLEHESGLASVPAPAHWEPYRQKQAGQVCYRLYRVAEAN